MVEIKLLNKQQLTQFLNSNEFEQLAFLPISHHRALSHLNNPRLREADVILLLAYEGTELLGYLGVLPEDLRINDKIEHGGFLSCLWIHPNARGKKIAQKLLDECFKCWDSRILVTEFTASAKGLYDKTGIFKDLVVKEGLRVYLKSELARILPEKKAIFKKFRFALSASDALINLFANFKTWVIRKPLLDFEFERITEISDELEDFISIHQQNELFARKKNELNWILNFPWVLNGINSYTHSDKYHFSSVAQKFMNLPYLIRNEHGEITAFLMFTNRDGRLKLPYCYFNEGNKEKVLNLINYVILSENCKTFTTFNPFLTESKILSSVGFYKKTVKRHYIISKVFPNIEHTFEVQDGDADCVFT